MTKNEERNGAYCSVLHALTPTVSIKWHCALRSSLRDRTQAWLMVMTFLFATIGYSSSYSVALVKSNPSTSGEDEIAHAAKCVLDSTVFKPLPTSSTAIEMVALVFNR